MKLKTWIPFKYKDFLDKTDGLSLSEAGAYIRLMAQYFKFETALPSDSRIYRLVGAMTEEERETLDRVIKEFFILKDGFLVNEDFDAIYDYQMRKHDKKSKAGHIGGSERARKYRQAISQSLSPSPDDENVSRRTMTKQSNDFDLTEQEEWLQNDKGMLEVSINTDRGMIKDTINVSYLSLKDISIIKNSIFDRYSGNDKMLEYLREKLKSKQIKHSLLYALSKYGKDHIINEIDNVAKEYKEGDVISILLNNIFA